MREADSFCDFEELAYAESLSKWEEKLFLTNGRIFMEVGRNGHEGGVYADLKKESYFLEHYNGIFVYSYHTHIQKRHLRTCPEPPSFEDFRADHRFRKRAAKRGRKVISRIIEKNGIWQYSWTSKIPYPPANLDEAIQDVMSPTDTLDEQIARLAAVYKQFEVQHISFHKKRIIDLL